MTTAAGTTAAAAAAAIGGATAVTGGGDEVRCWMPGGKWWKLGSLWAETGQWHPVVTV